MNVEIVRLLNRARQDVEAARLLAVQAHDMLLMMDLEDIAVALVKAAVPFHTR